MNIFDVRKTVCGGNHPRRTMLVADFARYFRTKIVLNRGNATFLREFAYVSRCNPEDLVAVILKVLEQCAVVGTNVNHQVLGPKSEQFAGFAVQFRKILAQNARSPAGIGISWRENDLRVHAEPQLYQFAP